MLRLDKEGVGDGEIGNESVVITTGLVLYVGAV